MMKPEQFGKYYKMAQQLASTHRIPCHELRWCTRQRAEVWMHEVEVQEIMYEEAALLCIDKGQSVPTRYISNKEMANIKKLSRELNRDIKIYQHEKK